MTVAKQLFKEENNDSLDQTLLLKHRLSQFGYSEYDIGSTELVKRLLADIIAATDAAKDFRHKADISKLQGANFKDQLGPLQSELTRLTSENNKLHQDLIKLQDTIETREIRTETYTKKNQQTINDLTFLNSQLKIQVGKEQQKFEDERARIEGVLAKFGIKGGDKSKQMPTEKILEKLQKIDIETGLLPVTDYPINFPKSDILVSDMVKIADAKVASLENEISEFQLVKSDLESNITTLQSQLAKREQEIARLNVEIQVVKSATFSGGLGSTADVKHNGSSSLINDVGVAKRRIDQLELQVDHLQEYIEGLENDISNFEEDKKMVISAYEDEKKVMDDELENEKAKSQKLYQHLAKLEHMVGDLNDIKGNSNTSPIRGQKNTAPHSKNMRSLSELSEKLKLTEGRLKIVQSQLTKTKSDNQELLQEITKLKQIKKGTSSIPIPIPKKNNAATSPVHKVSNDEILNLTTKNEYLVSKFKTMESERGGLEKQIAELKNSIEEYQNEISNLNKAQQNCNTESKNFKYQQEVEFMIKKVDALERAKEDAESEQRNLAAQVESLEQDRDKLISVLEKFENQLNEVHGNVEIVTRERDNLQELYEQVNKQLSRLRKSSSLATNLDESKTIAIQTESIQNNVDRSTSPVKPPRSPTVSGQSPNNRDDEAAELKKACKLQKLEISRLKNDLDSIMYGQNETGASAIEALRQLENERDGLRSVLDSKERDILLLEDNLKSLEKHVSRLKNQIVDHENKEDGLKSKLRQLEMEKDKQSFQTRDYKSKIEDWESKFERANLELQRTIKENEELSSSNKQQREFLGQVDHERDLIQVQLDQKDINLRNLQDEMERNKIEKQDLEKLLSTTRGQIDTLNHHLTEQERELSSLQRQLGTAIKDRDHFGSEAQRNAEEARNLGSDLMVMTKENQMLHSEMSEVGGERDRFKEELTECERHIQYLEDVLASKDHERDLLMSSYRKLISDHEKLDMTMKCTSEESNTMRLEVVMRDKRIQKLSRTVDELNSAVNQYRIDISAFEKQASNLTRSLATSERALRHLEGDKSRFVRELQVSRDLCITIERSKDDLQKQITALTIENEKLNLKLKKTEDERETLTNQIRSEVLKSERFENLLALERTRKIKSGKSDVNSQNDEDLNDKLAVMNSQHSATLASLSKELKSREDEIVALKSRIEFYENSLRESRHDFKETRKQLDELLVEHDHLKTQVASKTNLIQEMVSSTSQNDIRVEDGKSELEKKILQELQSTKKKLQKYEAKISQRFKRDDDDVEPEHTAATPAPKHSEGTTELLDAIIGMNQ